MSLFALIFCVTLCLLCSAFFSATETALFSLPSIQVKMYQNQNDPKKQWVVKLLSCSQELIVTILMLNIGINLFIQNIISHFLGEDSDWIIKIALPFVLTLLFGEILPKSFAMQHNKTLAPHVASIIQVPYRLFAPLRRALTSIVSPVSQYMFFFLKKEQHLSNQELRHVLHTSQNNGVLTQDEAQLIDGYLNLQDHNIKELMRPREEIVFYDINEPLSVLQDLFVTQRYSRLPICVDGLDVLQGIMTAQQFFLQQHNMIDAHNLKPFLEKPFFVPKSIPARQLLRQFYEKKQHLALVVDEYGEICGIISLEDLVEVVIGEIASTRDQGQNFTWFSKEVLIADAKLEISEFEKLFQVKLENKEQMITLGGWLLEQFKHIPQTGENLLWNDLFFHILAAKPHRIQRVYIRKRLN